jgi:hypothetical protein
VGEGHRALKDPAALGPAELAPSFNSDEEEPQVSHCAAVLGGAPRGGTQGGHPGGAPRGGTRGGGTQLALCALLSWHCVQ